MLVFVMLGLFVVMGLIICLVGIDIIVFGGSFWIDVFSIWVKLILLLVMMLFLLLVSVEVCGIVCEGMVYSLLCLVIVGVFILVGVGDMMFLVLGLLFISLVIFVLVVYLDDDFVIEVVMKYFVFGLVVGVVMIFGFMYWFGVVGFIMIVDFEGMEVIFLVVIFGLVVVIVGFGYKVFLVLFYFWVLDVYEGGFLLVVVFLFVVFKVGVLFVLI